MVNSESWFSMISDEQMAHIQLQKDRFHGEWNYTIS